MNIKISTAITGFAFKLEDVSKVYKFTDKTYEILIKELSSMLDIIISESESNGRKQQKSLQEDIELYTKI